MKKSELLDVLEHVAQYGVPSPRAVQHLDVGTTPYLAYFEREILDDLLRHGGATCRFLEGAYGCGKTHVLFLIENLAREMGFAVLRADLSHALSLNDWRGITRFIFSNIQISRSDQHFVSLPKILDHLKASEKPPVRKLEEAPLSHSGFKRAILTKMKPSSDLGNAEGLVDRFLLGERIGAGLLRQNGVDGVKEPLSGNNAEQVLATALSGLHKLGVPGTVLLFDETERTLIRPGRRVSKKLMVASNFLRRLVDGCSTGQLTALAAVFAVLPGFLDDCAENYPALGQRLASPRGDEHLPAFRWPVLPVEALSSILNREVFLERVVDRFVELSGENGSKGQALRSKLTSHGAEVLRQNAGRGYKRPLMKRLSTVVANHI